MRKEFRIILPITVEEYNIGQLWSVAEASKNETGGGEGIEVLQNKPYDELEMGKGQYTEKVYHLASRVPTFVNWIAPKSALIFKEEAWNAYPHCKTVVTNNYMQEKFEITITSWYKPDLGESENVHNLNEKDWKDTEIIYVDIANDAVSRSDYKEEFDPQKVTFDIDGRKALGPNWIKDLRDQAKASKNGACGGAPTTVPYMCAYKLVDCKFSYWGLQNRVEKFIQAQEKRIFTNFNRQLYCWLKHWHNLSMADIRLLEDKTKHDLDEMRSKGSIRGTKGE